MFDTRGFRRVQAQVWYGIATLVPSVKRSFAIHTDPYSYVVHVLVCDIAQGERWFKRKKYASSLTNLAGLTVIPDEGSDIFLWLESRNIPVLVHELLHVAVAVLKGSGVGINASNDEVIAHLLASLVERTLAKLK